MEERRYWVDRDGNIYGPFRAQEDGFPCAGEVVQFYRKQLGMSVQNFAQALADDALSYLNKAIELAQPLNNAELLGRLLYKRGLVLYESRHFSEALRDLEQANQL